jgi:hypothetical protein
MRYGSLPSIFEGNPYEEHTEQMHQLGAKLLASNGDIYRYTKAASTDFVAGKLYVSQPRNSNHANIALSAAAAVGDTKVIPTLGATAADANEYDEGWLVFNDVSPEGEVYTITKHEAAALSTACDVWIEPALKTAATTSSEVTLLHNTWNKPAIGQLIAESAAGIPIQDWDVSVAEYGWLKTRGVAAALSDGTITVGYVVTISDATDGAVGLYSDVDAEVPVGQMMQAGVSGEYNPIYLYID